MFFSLTLNTQCATPMSPLMKYILVVTLRFSYVYWLASRATPADDATAGSAIMFVALRPRLVKVLDEAAERVVGFGMSCLLTSSTPVAGEVLWVSSHCSIARHS